MSEHDDALLDEDFASLPDINDEEYYLDISNDDATVSTQESINEQLSCDLKSSLEDILDLTDLNAFEELENNTVVESEAIILNMRNIKQENIKTECSNKDDYKVQFNDKVILPIDKSNLSEDNFGLNTKCKNVIQIESNRQKHKNICSNETEYQQAESFETKCSSCHFVRYISNKNHSYIQPINHGPSFYQPDFQDERIYLHSNNSSLLNDSYPIDHFNILNESYPIGRLDILNEPYLVEHLSNRPVFCHNFYANYGCHLPVPACLYHQPCQNPPFPNQILPMQQSIQMSHSHMPIMTNPYQSILFDSNRQMMYNQNNIVPNYHEPTYDDQAIHTSHNQPQYILNPIIYNRNHSNRQKILVNRHFSPPQTKRDNWLCHEFDKTDLFLKKIATKKVINQNWNSSSGSTTNMDPYSYFSDIWQTKDSCESNSPKRSLSPEIIFREPILDILKNKKFKSMKDANQQEIKSTKIYKTSSLSEPKKVCNIRKRNVKLRNNIRRKQKNGGTKIKYNDGNNTKLIENQKKNTDVEIKKKENMDPEMIEYCEKIKEQKRRREKFLLEKEIRRKQLAMEKFGIKTEPLTEH